MLPLGEPSDATGQENDPFGLDYHSVPGSGAHCTQQHSPCALGYNSLAQQRWKCCMSQYSPCSDFFNVWNKIEKFILSCSGQIGCLHSWDNLKLFKFLARTGGPRVGFWGPYRGRKEEEEFQFCQSNCGHDLTQTQCPCPSTRCKHQLQSSAKRSWCQKGNSQFQLFPWKRTLGTTETQSLLTS